MKDFSVNVGFKNHVFETFPETLEFIAREIAQWNAYDPEDKLVIKVRKVPGMTPVVGIHASDSTTAQEKIS